MSYSDYTYNSKNPLVRFAHRQRFKISLDFSNPKDGDKILDYGCGDGKFLNSIKANCILVGYEPYMEPVLDNKIQIFKMIGEVNDFADKHGKFDVITCFEVLEHFNQTNQRRMLKEMKNLLSESGHLIISVPIEIGFPPLIKNLRRKMLSTDPLYTYKNIIKSALGYDFNEYRAGEGYLFEHLGFHYKKLEKIFDQDFVIRKRRYSPFRRMGYNFNSQVFYKLKSKV